MKLRLRRRFKYALPIALLGLLSSCDAGKETSVPSRFTDNTEPTEKVIKTEAEWKELLTDEQFYVARKAGTERAFSALYKKIQAQGKGDYHCVGCNAKLFKSEHKFDSRSGWPSFYDVANSANIATKTDTSAGMVRTEVLCAKCDAHLGHLFQGENYGNPINDRYCINGVVLRFAPEETAEKTTEEVADNSKAEVAE